ncbi:hypothetical protein E4188_23210 (plasmid) [Aeromonas media]|uniref:Uncharacterized protein n=2 Tax=Aeromonas TaxID=642 RepID=A0ABX6NZM0_AERME|nr:MULTISPECIES: hypothetical protein [Aeromonas]ASI21385.1 hypothetical protein CE456_00650 [Aeromonas salmonicida]QJT41411.1 hypothetical protein E4188_23210 [Aeromonas media]QLI59201.1 hypothetical protein C0708_22980 [Aeromonas caviae]QLI60431.1 hypothetical protein C1C91_22625 [Aeromonas caviae]HDN9374644.1 hypothetical protein [Aeromonas salmonicida]
MKKDSEFLKSKSSETDSLLSSFGVSSTPANTPERDSLVGNNQVHENNNHQYDAGLDSAGAIEAVTEIDPMDVARELMGEDSSAGWLVGGVVENTEQTTSDEKNSVTEHPQQTQPQRSESGTDCDAFLPEITQDDPLATDDTKLQIQDETFGPPLESIHAESSDRQKSSGNILSRMRKKKQPVPNPSSEHEHVIEPAQDHDHGYRHERYDADPIGGRTIAAAYVSLALGVFSFGLASYTFLSLPKNQNTQQTFNDLRTEMVARMDKIESNTVNRTSEIDAAVGEISRHVQQQSADLSALNSELSSLKSSTEKLSTDTDLSLTWARQTRQLVDNIQESVDTLRVSQEASQAAINKLKNAGTQTIPQTARAAESHQYETKIQPARKPQLVKVIDGHTLFDVDDWGGILLVTMMNGDDVKRLQVGDEIGVWRLESADRQSRQAVFIQGDKVLTVVASGGY